MFLACPQGLLASKAMDLTLLRRSAFLGQDQPLPRAGDRLTTPGKIVSPLSGALRPSKSQHYILASGYPTTMFLPYRFYVFR